MHNFRRCSMRTWILLLALMIVFAGPAYAEIMCAENSAAPQNPPADMLEIAEKSLDKPDHKINAADRLTIEQYLKTVRDTKCKQGAAEDRFCFKGTKTYEIGKELTKGASAPPSDLMKQLSPLPYSHHYLLVEGDIALYSEIKHKILDAVTLQGTTKAD